MGLDQLTDEEIKNVLTQKGGLKKLLADKKNVARFIGMNSAQKRRIADILQYEAGMSKAEAKKIIDQVAAVHSSVTDFFV